MYIYLLVKHKNKKKKKKKKKKKETNKQTNKQKVIKIKGIN